MNKELIPSFKRIFQKDCTRMYFAPGRVNLIGEHIDYNGGHVFPFALDFGIYLCVKDREDRKVNLYSFNFPSDGITSFDLDSLAFDQKGSYTNYVKGVFATFLKHGYEISHGFDVTIYGDIPGSGLSSSAALEVSFCVLLNDTFSFSLSKTKLAVLAREAEVEFCHLNCGIMDQFASANGKQDCAIYLDCATLQYKYVPLSLKGYSLCIINSNVKHSLVTSHYNERREECLKALSALKNKANIENLCQLTPEEYLRIKDSIPNPVLRKRASFCVLEEQRTKDAYLAMEQNDIPSLGRLLTESGRGLKEDYDATCFEIDALTDICTSQKGCLGARETGGGWGGNVIALVKEEKREAFQKEVKEKYLLKIGKNADIHFVQPSEGGRRIL